MKLHRLVKRLERQAAERQEPEPQDTTIVIRRTVVGVKRERDATGSIVSSERVSYPGAITTRVTLRDGKVVERSEESTVELPERDPLAVTGSVERARPESTSAVPDTPRPVIEPEPEKRRRFLWGTHKRRGG